MFSNDGTASTTPAGYLYRSALNSTRSRFRRLQLTAKRTLSLGEPEDPFAAADLRDQVRLRVRGWASDLGRGISMSNAPTPEGLDLVLSDAVKPRRFLKQSDGSLLPAGVFEVSDAWQDAEIKPYVSSRCAVCYFMDGGGSHLGRINGVVENAGYEFPPASWASSRHRLKPSSQRWWEPSTRREEGITRPLPTESRRLPIGVSSAPR